MRHVQSFVGRWYPLYSAVQQTNSALTWFDIQRTASTIFRVTSHYSGYFLHRQGRPKAPQRRKMRHGNLLEGT